MTEKLTEDDIEVGWCQCDIAWACNSPSEIIIHVFKPNTLKHAQEIKQQILSNQKVVKRLKEKIEEIKNDISPTNPKNLPLISGFEEAYEEGMDNIKLLESILDGRV